MDPALLSRNFLRIPVSPIPIYFILPIYFLCFALNSLTTSAGIYNKVCYHKYRDLQLCSNATFTQSHTELQDESASWNNYNSLVAIIPTLLAVWTLSTYCDKVGYKIPMLIPCLSLLLSTVSLVLFVTPQYIDWPIEIVFICTFISSFGGSQYLINMSCFSYVTVASREENRKISLAFAEGSLMIGPVIGLIVSGPIIDRWGLEANAYLSAILAFMGVLIVIFLVTDIPKETPGTFSIKELFQFRNLLEAIRCVFKLRPGNDRMNLLLCFLTIGLLLTAIVGNLTLSFLYFVKEIGMSMTNFSIYKSATTLAQALVGPSLLWLTKTLGLDSMHVALVFIVMSSLGYILISVGNGNLYMIWVGTFSNFGLLAVFGVIRGLQTSLVGKDELGKMFAFDSFMQIFVNAAFSTAFNYLYESTVDYWPAMYYSACAGLNIIAMAVFCVLILILQSVRTDKSHTFVSIQEDP